MTSRLLIGAVALGLSAGAATAQEKVTFLTSWKAQAEHGGYYQALVKGYYKDCGVDVSIRQGGPGIDTAQLLTGKAVDFTMSSHIDAVLHMNAAGFPARALSAAFQVTPQILMAHADSDVKSFEDMKGKPVMISQGSRATYWPFFRKKFGWEDTQLRSYTGQLAQWLSDKTIIQQGLVTNEPFLVKREVGWEPKVFMLADAGYRTYGSILTTSQETIDKRPKVVACMVSATSKGWVEFMTGDPKPALDAIKKEAPNNTDDLMASTIQIVKNRKLVMNDDTEKMGFGVMTQQRWKDHYELLKDVNLLKSEVDVNQVLATQFLKADAKK